MGKTRGGENNTWFGKEETLEIPIARWIKTGEGCQGMSKLTRRERPKQKGNGTGMTG